MNLNVRPGFFDDLLRGIKSELPKDLPSISLIDGNLVHSPVINEYVLNLHFVTSDSTGMTHRTISYGINFDSLARVLPYDYRESDVYFVIYQGLKKYICDALSLNDVTTLTGMLSTLMVRRIESLQSHGLSPKLILMNPQDHYILDKHLRSLNDKYSGSVRLQGLMIKIVPAEYLNSGCMDLVPEL